MRNSDIGTGTYTIMAQVAADMLGLPLDNITHQARRFEPAAGAGRGRFVDGGLRCARASPRPRRTSALSCCGLRKTIDDSPLAKLAVGRRRAARTASSSREAMRQRAVPVADVMRHGKVERIEKQKLTTSRLTITSARSNAHSAIFAEVRVDEQLGVIRVARVVSAVAAGRILNPKTAGSQIIGGVVWGIGMALHEETVIDHRFGRIMNANIAEYHVPVHADVHDIKVIFVDEPDDDSNPLGLKGVGEIGIVGVAAAIANAVYHATGVRVRDLPITLDKILG